MRGSPHHKIDDSRELPLGAKAKLLYYPWLGWLFLLASTLILCRDATHDLITYVLSGVLMLIGLLVVKDFIRDWVGSQYVFLKGNVANKAKTDSRAKVPGHTTFVIESHYVEVNGLRIWTTRRDFQSIVASRKYHICYARNSHLMLWFEEIG
jgi:hypothetical protein